MDKLKYSYNDIIMLDLSIFGGRYSSIEFQGFWQSELGRYEDLCKCACFIMLLRVWIKKMQGFIVGFEEILYQAGSPSVMPQCFFRQFSLHYFGFLLGGPLILQIRCKCFSLNR